MANPSVCRISLEFPPHTATYRHILPRPVASHIRMEDRCFKALVFIDHSYGVGGVGDVIASRSPETFLAKCGTDREQPGRKEVNFLPTSFLPAGLGPFFLQLSRKNRWGGTQRGKEGSRFFDRFAQKNRDVTTSQGPLPRSEGPVTGGEGVTSSAGPAACLAAVCVAPGCRSRPIAVRHFLRNVRCPKLPYRCPIPSTLVDDGSENALFRGVI